MSKGTRTASWLDDRSASIDLRRAIDDRTATTVVNRAEWLGESDRALVLAVFRDGLSATMVARLRGHDARQVRRLVARAAARVLDPLAVFVAVRSQEWSPARARVGQAVFHHGCSLRDSSSKLGLSLYTVRKHRDAIEHMFESERHGATRDDASRRPDRSWR
ncbi:MAG: hypothetical protein AAGA55_11120 [Planctomycetota bacterium]